MKAATIRDLRTRFPAVRALLERQGEVIVTHRGRPVIVLRAYDDPVPPSRGKVDYYARLKQRMPKPLTTAQLEALDDSDRGER